MEQSVEAVLVISRFCLDTYDVHHSALRFITAGVYSILYENVIILIIIICLNIHFHRVYFRYTVFYSTVYIVTFVTAFFKITLINP